MLFCDSRYWPSAGPYAPLISTPVAIVSGRRRCAAWQPYQAECGAHRRPFLYLDGYRLACASLIVVLETLWLRYE